MAAMVEQAGEIDPGECRRSAERFSPYRVAEHYEAVYRHAIERREEDGNGIAGSQAR